MELRKQTDVCVGCCCTGVRLWSNGMPGRVMLDTSDAFESLSHYDYNDYWYYYYYYFMFNARQSVFTLFAWLRQTPLKKNTAPTTVSPTRHDAAASINACPPDHALPQSLSNSLAAPKDGPADPCGNPRASDASPPPTLEPPTLVEPTACGIVGLALEHLARSPPDASYSRL